MYVGYVQRGDKLELAATDPHLGTLFYTVDQTNPDTASIRRDDGSCLSCHASTRTQSVPGLLIRSVSPDAAGRPLLRLGSTNVDDTTPHADRHGGWLVTGAPSNYDHRGNCIYDRDGDAVAEASDRLLDHVDENRYPVATSDLVALLVLQHQTQVHNAITLANFETRIALHQSESMNELLHRPAGFVSDSARRRIASVGDKLLARLLMVDQAPLPVAIDPTGPFARAFALRGCRDERGHSLRDFDLSQRIFRYPCSYLVLSESFAALPAPVQSHVLGRLGRHLRQPNRDPSLGVLTDHQCEVIQGILTEHLSPQQAGWLLAEDPPKTKAHEDRTHPQ